MRFGTMFSDVSLALFKKPVTRMYPYQKSETPPRLRGQVLWEKSSCTGCGLCVKDCPSNALELFIIDRKNKQFVMRYHADRCTFCAQCVESCRSKSIHLSQDNWELAALTTAPFDVFYGEDSDVELIMATKVAGDAEQTKEI